MQLITMAHLGEAQSVIENFGLARLTPHLFKGDDLICLITGEGPFEASTATASILGKYQISEVINIGIAGAISDDLKVEDFCPIRSIYLVIDGKPQFKSFKCGDMGYDCISSFDRILDEKAAQVLSGVGHIVDREAWGVAHACKHHQVPFRAFKLISDKAGTLNACEVVKGEATEWSQKILGHLNKILHLQETPSASTSLEGFYFTFSSRHRFEDLLNKLSLRSNQTTADTLNTLPLDELRELKISPKDKAKKLMTLLEEKLDPLKAKLQRSLSDWKGPFEDKNIQIMTDPNLEETSVKIVLEIENNQQLAERITAIKQLDLSFYQKLRNGDLFDVE